MRVPYFRAIGDRETIAAAIETTEPGKYVDASIDIALGQRVHPRKGLELVIAQHGICRAINYFEQFPDLEQREGETPASNNIPELIAGRDWLFGEFDAYVDT
jgi:hypothetical protein